MFHAVSVRLLAAVLFLPLVVRAGAQPAEPPFLDVNGYGAASAPPDTALIQVGAKFIEPTVAEAQAKVNEAVTQTIEAVKAAGVPEVNIRTSNLSVSAVYERVDRERERREPLLLGYKAHNTVRIRLDDVARAGTIVDLALKAGANELDEIEFGLQDPTPQYTEALRRAAVDATLTAETIAAAMNVRIVGIAEMSDTSRRLRRGGGGQSPFTGIDNDTPIEPGLVAVEAEVSVRFRIAPK